MTNSRSRGAAQLLTVVVAVCFAAQLVPVEARAETLKNALRSAYLRNPQLDAERANLRATDEFVPQARSNWRPQISVSADTAVEREKISNDPTTPATTHPSGYSVTLNQPIFRGFRTYNAVNAAEAVVRAGRATLQSTEQAVLLSAVTAYMDVVRDTEILKLYDDFTRALSTLLTRTQNRFSTGEVTSTDVSQTRARRAQAIIERDAARASFQSSRATYEQVIGNPPNSLERPTPPYELLPNTLERATRAAEIENPRVVASLYNEQAAHFNVKEIFGELLPSVDLDATYMDRYTGGGDLAQVRTRTGTVMGTLSIPIYQRGGVSSRVRQAKHLHVQSIQLVQDARTRARENVLTAWSQLQAAQSQSRTTSTLVQSYEAALTGVRGEQEIGQRSVLEILDAEQDLLSARIVAASVRRDIVVTSYAVLSAMGRMTADRLELNSLIYDPDIHYHEIRRRWFGVRIQHHDGRQEHFQADDPNTTYK